MMARRNLVPMIALNTHRLASRLAVLVLMLIFAPVVLGALGGTESEPTAGYTQWDVALLVIYVLLAIGFSFHCSVAEAVLLSITPSYIAGLKETNPKRAALLKQLKQDNVDRSLAAILTLNTIANTMGAIGAGAKATAVFGSSWFGFFSAVMTLMILFLSEIIPKTLGAIYWRRLAGATALFIRTLVFILYPLINVSEALTRMIAHGKNVHLFSREEFLAMARIGEQAGKLNEDESRIIRNLFRLHSLTAADVMTPRTVILALQQDMTVNEALGEQGSTHFSRLPLYDADLDDIASFALKDDLLLAKAKGQGEVKVLTLQREMQTVTGFMHLSDLLEFLLDHRQHIVVVVDEYGGTEGLVSLEDVVETLLGTEIVDEHDTVADMQLLAKRQWLKRAKTIGVHLEE